jgi:phosphoribosyl 1,2-cyclic phosphodiesterase
LDSDQDKRPNETKLQHELLGLFEHLPQGKGKKQLCGLRVTSSTTNHKPICQQPFPTRTSFHVRTNISLC